MRPLLLTLALLCTACVSGLGGSEPQTMRFYSAALDFEVEPVAPVEAMPVRVGRVVAARHLGERMVWRRAGVEYGFSELDRWTEPPAAWLERALTRSLRDAHGLPAGRGAGELLLELELFAFERDVDANAVRVGFTLVAMNGRAVVLEDSFHTVEPLARTGAQGYAEAARAALARSVGQAATAVAALARR